MLQDEENGHAAMPYFVNSVTPYGTDIEGTSLQLTSPGSPLNRLTGFASFVRERNSIKLIRSPFFDGQQVSNRFSRSFWFDSSHRSVTGGDSRSFGHEFGHEAGRAFFHQHHPIRSHVDES